MTYIAAGVGEAFRLLASGDREIYRIILLSLAVSLTATVSAAAVGVPLGLVAGLKRFPGRRVFRTVVYAGMGVPPVVVGLLVMLLLSRRGPLGRYELLFTPQAMGIAQFLLVLPIVVGIVFGGASREARQIDELGVTLGGTRGQRLLLLVREMSGTLWLAAASAFGRAISEVGAVMLVGGNIRDRTRVMTTFIALNNSMGEYERSIAMGLVLLVLSLAIHAAIHAMKGGGEDG